MNCKSCGRRNMLVKKQRGKLIYFCPRCGWTTPKKTKS